MKMDNTDKFDEEDNSEKKIAHKKREPKLSPITRFRALVHKVIDCLSWLTEQDEEDKTVSDKVGKNIRLIQRKKTAQVTGLTYKVKTILMKHVDDRTESDIKILWKAMKRLKCFKRYPDDVKRRLIAVAGFITYGPNRVIVREGQYAHATYFICSGNIVISKLIWDVLFEIWVPQEFGVMGPGDMFGEVSLLHDIPRTATCTTITTCAFLTLEREYFHSILKETLMGQWNERKKAISTFPYFKGLSDTAIMECCMLAYMKTYEPKSTILGYGKGKINYTHFILEGECQALEELNIIVEKKRGLSLPQRLYTEGSRLFKGEVVETYFMQAYLLYKGQCFCIGEDLKTRAIVATTQVKCLLCPKNWMMQYNDNKTWDRIIHYFDNNLPTKQQLFKIFMENRKWIQYRKNTINSLLKRDRQNVTTGTSIHDVPYSIRLYEDWGPHRKGFQRTQKIEDRRGFK